jgi:hypothetical protein
MCTVYLHAARNGAIGRYWYVRPYDGTNYHFTNVYSRQPVNVQLSATLQYYW